MHSTTNKDWLPSHYNAPAYLTFCLIIPKLQVKQQGTFEQNMLKGNRNIFLQRVGNDSMVITLNLQQRDT